MDGLVDPAGAGGQRRLEQVSPVGGEDEGDVDVLTEAVHLVEELEQQRMSAGPEAPLVGDEVDVLHHDRRGWRTRAIEHASRIAPRASPESTTTVTPSRRPSRWRTVCVLPVPGGP